MSYENNEDGTQENLSPSEILGDEQTDFEPSLSSGKSGSKQMSIVIGLLLVAAVVIWFMYFKNGPDSAQAGLTPNDGGSQIKQFLDSGNINMMKQTLKETEKIVLQFKSSPGKTQIPLSSLRTNPFRELEPKADSPTASSQKELDREEELHHQAIAAVADIKLQSIIAGTRYKACMINNTMYREGQAIGVLTIEQIAPGSVIMSSGKYRFEVKMQN
jgi:hypothetical protein